MFGLGYSQLCKLTTQVQLSQNNFLGSGNRVSVQALHDRLRQEASNNPSRSIRIDGDELARYRDIVHVLDLCQFEGFTKISMHTRQ